MDFSKTNDTAQLINNFVAVKTKGTIQELVKPDMFDELDRIFLINVVYFNSNWLQPFKPYFTRKDKFYISETEMINVDFMKMTKQV